MLILTRRTGETILIGDDGPNQFTITVLGVKGSQVRIGINAPKSVPVHREEIAERIRREIKTTGVKKANNHSANCGCQICAGAGNAA